MTAKEVRKYLLTELADVGALLWASAASGSEYIKFKDSRVGSIRIADHKVRDKYQYRFSIDPSLPDAEVREHLKIVVQGIRLRISELDNFDPSKYVVFDRRFGTYIIAKDYVEYAKYVLNIT